MTATVAHEPRPALDLRRLTRTDDAWTPTLLRVTLGAVMLPHGVQKLLSLSTTLGWFASALSIPAPLALLVIAAELVGGAALIAGLFTRLAAASIALVMLGAVVMVHAQHGFFMNWFGTQSGEGYEYHLLAIALAVALVITGGGKHSVDRKLS